MYGDEYNIFLFLEHPDVMIGQALALKFKPVDLDVLPLYIVLVLALPAILWGLIRHPRWTLLGSATLYVLARILDWNLPSYPGETGTSIRSPGSCCLCSAPGAASARPPKSRA
jgi:hypothetical protein